MRQALKFPHYIQAEDDYSDPFMLLKAITWTVELAWQYVLASLDTLDFCLLSLIKYILECMVNYMATLV